MSARFFADYLSCILVGMLTINQYHFSKPEALFEARIFPQKDKTSIGHSHGLHLDPFDQKFSRSRRLVGIKKRDELS